MVVPAVALQGTHIHQAELVLLVKVIEAVIIAHTPEPVEVVQEVLGKISAAPQEPVVMVVLLYPLLSVDLLFIMQVVEAVVEMALLAG
jgi:hypothetical protein